MRYVPSGRDQGIYVISQPNGMRLYRICGTNISHERERVYRRKDAVMNDKTIKELAVELTVETTAMCDNIEGRAVFTN